MSTYVSNRNGGGATDEQGHYRFQTKVWAGNVLNGLLPKQNSPLARNVLVPAGDLKIDYGQYSYTAWNDADVTVAIATADTTNPRFDRIIAFIDRGMTSGGTNNVGYLKFIAVAGTPNASPTKASDATVQTAVNAAATGGGGAGSPWCELAVVRVNANATTIPDSLITDTRVMVSPNLPVAAKNAWLNGWLDANETWAYSSWNSSNNMGVITVPAGANNRYAIGTYLRFVQATGGTKYGKIVAITSTSITLWTGGLFTLNNEAITAPFYSIAATPPGVNVRLTDGTPYGFSAYKNASQSIPAATIAWGAEDFDDAAAFDVATGIFTAPVAGDYPFSAFIQLTTAGTTTVLYMQLAVNGTTVAEKANTQAGSNGGGDIVHTLRLAAGDQVKVNGFMSSGSFSSVANKPYSGFAGRLANAR